jgi:hypothetical protein
MRRLFTLTAIVVVFLIASGLFASGIAVAAPFSFGDGGVALQGVLNGITLSPVAGSSSVNVLTDGIPDPHDSYWAITATGGSVSTMIIEVAGFANTNCFGVYDMANPSNTVQLFTGPDSAGAQVTLSISGSGDVYINHSDTGIDFSGNHFGFYLYVPTTRNTWYSDTSLNSDNIDHMVAYQGKDIDEVQLSPWPPGLWTDNEYVLAFEDLDAGSTVLSDYADMVVMVESVMPTPEPTTLLLLGIGMLGLTFTTRRKALT